MNRLATEKSPYLLQHANNPVDWFAWGEEAFRAAREGDKPIFLSVGYSTCHWCHVMEHESFENDEVAKVLNEHFISIKVDREERPDVDRMFMTYVQAATGSGGWPMSVWLTPGLQPFHGGTYFPPDSRWGRPGFLDLLREIARLWREERERVVTSASGMAEQLAAGTALEGGRAIPGERALARGVGEFRGSFDHRNGGFGGAPKFPRPSELFFLLREYRRSGDRDALEMVTATLRAMADGGMRDHVGGGFHRYSVDGQWRVPHFEKMLYDQAQLVLAYVEAAQAAQDLSLLDVAEDTLRYVQREMTDAAGGFYSAEDADSLPPGAPPGAHEAEGAFYLWEAAEMDALLGEDAPLAREHYGAREGGNALQDPLGEFTGKNILYAAVAPQELAARHGLPVETVTERLARSRQRLFEARHGRPRPHLDDKVLTAWNGLMIGAFARASRVVRAFWEAAAEGTVSLRSTGAETPRVPLRETAPTAEETAGTALRAGREAAADTYLRSARDAASFIRSRMWRDDTGTLLRRYRDGDAAIEGYAEDYACLVFGLLELFEAEGDAGWLEWAVRLQRRQDELFWDAAEGGWFSTTGADPSVALRLKEDYDGAEPAASSIAAMNLLRLGHLVADSTAAERVERTLRLFAPRLEGMARAVPMMLAVLSACHAGVQQIVIAGDDRQAAAGMLSAAGKRYLPFAVLVPVLPHTEAIDRLLPLVAHMRPRDGRPTAFVCRDFACQSPTTDPEELARQLD